MKTITTLNTEDIDTVKIEFQQGDSKEIVNLTWSEYEIMLKDILSRSRV